MSETKGLWNKLLGKNQAPEGSTNELWKDLISDAHDKTTETLKGQDVKQDSADDNQKKAPKTTVKNPAHQPESTEGMEYMLDYADENYGARIAALIMVYMALKDDVNQGEEEESEKESLLDYLGLDKMNLTKILMAAFGKGNTKTDQDFEIWGLVGEAKDLQTLLYKQIFGLNEKANKTAIRDMIDELAKKLTLPELLSFNAQKRKKIVDTIDEIMEKEEDEERKLTVHEKIGIAKSNGFTKPMPKKIFDEKKIEQMVAEIHRDGREMDPEPSQSGANQPPVRTTPPPPPPAQPNVANESAIQAAMSYLNDLFTFFQQETPNNELINDLNGFQADASMGTALLASQSEPDTVDIKQIIEEQFETNDESEINQIAIQIYNALKDKYPLQTDSRVRLA